MEHNESSYRDALARIAQLASAAAGVTVPAKPRHNGGSYPPGDDLACSVKALPSRLHEKAAQTATKINPANAPLHQPLGAAASSPEPQSIVLLTSRYWGAAARQLTVSFMESTEPDLRARIVSHLNAWSLWASVSFVETGGVGEVRITRGPGGYYSYLGTDIKLIPQDRPTMGLEGFTMGHDESEYRRVIRHEAGHTLGFPHEHMRQELVARIDRARAYAYYLATQGWSPTVVDQQVLTPLDQASIYGTSPDEDSIMCYQLPGSITVDGVPIRGGLDINATDYAFSSLVYPKLPFAPAGQQVAADEWDAAEDVLTPA
jgi:hypothetical protein